jgi:hypothetical protein
LCGPFHGNRPARVHDLRRPARYAMMPRAVAVR